MQILLPENVSDIHSPMKAWGHLLKIVLRIKRMVQKVKVIIMISDMRQSWAYKVAGA
jgi:hypothetical protein